MPQRYHHYENKRPLQSRNHQMFYHWLISVYRRCYSSHVGTFCLSCLVLKYLSALFNPFLANTPILYSLKTPKNQRFSGIFRGHKMKILARNGLIDDIHMHSSFNIKWGKVFKNGPSKICGRQP